jgi:hypothetical protein
MMERLDLLRSWLVEELRLDGRNITPASEDASFRRYFRVSWQDGSAIVMDAPPDKEDCAPFIDITARLRKCRVNAPAIRAADLRRGFLLLDDLGKQLYLDALTPDNADTLYSEAMRALVRIQRHAETAGLPPYDEALLRREMALFRDWLVERHLRIPLTPAVRKLLERTFALLAASALEQPRVFVHRDYHSRNLLVTHGGGPGIIDYQDAVHGPITYDLVSLLKDCYVKWPRDRVLRWVEEYLAMADWDTGDAERFLRWFDLMGAQRHLKASGIFARLRHRDGKAGFIRDIPRTLSYILDLEAVYPELAPLAGFIRERVMPELERRGS